MNYSEVAISILTLLNNAKDLLFHSDRQNANRVVKAVKIYADETGYPVNADKFKVFSKVLLDSRSETLCSIINDIAKDIVKLEHKKQSQKRHQRIKI